jgi:type II secretion system protein N
MRVAVAVVVIAGCSPDSGAFDPDDAVRDSFDAVRVEVHRRDVPLEEMPIVTRLLRGLPMSGLADVEIDLEVPKHGGVPQYRRARGSIAVRCATCAVGDGTAKLKLPDMDGIPFGQLELGRFEAWGDVTDGKVDITKWEIKSPDLMLEARLHIDLADKLEDSRLDGCVRFHPTPLLLRRDPKTYALLTLTGASLDPDGLYTIKIEGTIGDRKYVAKACRVTGSPSSR